MKKIKNVEIVSKLNDEKVIENDGIFKTKTTQIPDLQTTSSINQFEVKTK